METNYHILGAILMIIGAGVLGGAINLWQARNDKESVPKNCGYYFLLSIAATSTVPLFLSLTKSNLLNNVLAKDLNPEEWFIFFAVCVVAAIFSQNFLETVSKKLLQKVDQIEQKANKAKSDAEKAGGEAKDALQAATDQARASERLEQDTLTPKALLVQKPLDLSKFDPTEQKVLQAIVESEFERRTLGGIASDTSLPYQTIRAALGKLIKMDVVREVIGPRTGNTLYEVRLNQLQPAKKE
jgi:hypothetical protein